MTLPATIEPVQKEILTLGDQVQFILVVDQQSFDYATDLMNSVVKRLRRQIAEHHDPLIKSAYDNWKLNIAAKKNLDDPLNNAERTLKGKIGAWLQEQERIRVEVQRAIEAEAQRKAEEEQLARAEALEAQGADQAAVTAELDHPVVVEQVAVAAPTFEKRSDVGIVKTWSAEVQDFASLVKAAAQNPQLLGYLLANQPALNASARMQKELFMVPGVRAVSKVDVRGKAG